MSRAFDNDLKLKWNSSEVGVNPYADTLSFIGCFTTYSQLVKITDWLFVELKSYETYSEADKDDCIEYRNQMVRSYNWAREKASTRFPKRPVIEDIGMRLASWKLQSI